MGAAIRGDCAEGEREGERDGAIYTHHEANKPRIYMALKSNMRDMHHPINEFVVGEQTPPTQI